MAAELLKEGSGTVLKLSGRVGVSDAASLHRLAVLAAEAGVPVVIDLIAAEDVDTAGLQIVAALSRSLAARGESLRCVSVPAMLARRWQSVGFGELLA